MVYSSTVFTLLIALWFCFFLAIVIAHTVSIVVEFVTDLNNISKNSTHLCNEAHGVV